MYYQSYEDYIKNILGYPVQTTNSLYSNNTYNHMVNSMPNYNKDILDLYPEIYKIVNPMVCKICETNTKPITEELVEQMTDEIYLNLEGNIDSVDSTVNVRVTVPNEKNNSSKKNKIANTNTWNFLEQSKTVSIQNTKEKNGNITNSTRQTKDKSLLSGLNQTENTTKIAERKLGENRQVRQNSTLKDLIRILILNRLLDGYKPQRTNNFTSPYPERVGTPQISRPPINPRGMFR